MSVGVATIDVYPYTLFLKPRLLEKSNTQA